jgi:hypothetical protein
MALADYPSKFLRFNDLQSKQLCVVVEIEGADLLSNVTIQTVWRYGDAGLVYGLPGVVYGGLKPFSANGVTQRALLSLDSGLTISQKIEPEQGRGSVSTLTMSFIDKDKYMTQLCTPGLILDEILGKRVRVRLGYQQTSYPEDYFVIFRGIITSVDSTAGMYRMQFSDPNIKNKQKFFTKATSKLSAGISDVVTTIPVVSNSDFHKKITGPDGTYFTGVKTYLKIGDEVIQYQQTGSEGTGFGTNQFLNVLRGQRGTIAEAHALDDTVENTIEIQDHGIDMALRHMLSGWNGPFKSNIDVENFVVTGDPALGAVSNCIVLPWNKNADDDYGISVGDFLYITGATNGANNVSPYCKVTGFVDILEQPNRGILTDATFISEVSSPAVFAVRSQYDVYPITCGSGLQGEDVDVARHIELKNTFLAAVQNSYRFYVKDSKDLKEWLATQIYLPMNCYSLTRFGRLSVGLTKPAIADQRLQVIDHSMVLNAQQVGVSRATNNRKFFNQIDFYIDPDDTDKFTSVIHAFDSDSINQIGIEATLPISSLGARSDLGFDVVQDRRVQFFLQRYKRGAVQIKLQVNWLIGSQIEAGDIIALKDEGNLQIANWATGDRDIGTQLFEIIDRQYNIKDGVVTLMLLGGISGSLNDRFATIAPSSLIDTGTTSSVIRVKESFGEIFPGDERKKWNDYVGLKIIVHDKKWTYFEEVTIEALSESDDHAFSVVPPLSFTPAVNDIVDLAPYSTSTDPTDQALAKTVHAFFDPSVTVVTGISGTQFTVAPGDASKFQVGFPVYVHNTDHSIASDTGNEPRVTNVTGVTITVSPSLGFTPSAGMKVDLIGFVDGGGPYRFI